VSVGSGKVGNGKAIRGMESGKNQETESCFGYTALRP
jgi:hypothetical protein